MKKILNGNFLTDILEEKLIFEPRNYLSLFIFAWEFLEFAKVSSCSIRQASKRLYSMSKSAWKK